MTPSPTNHVGAPTRRPVCLIVMDGLAYGAKTDNPAGDAVALASTPNLDALWREWPHSTLAASGPAVGLPEGQMGNSEVGHLNMGAGRVVYQELTRIDLAISDRSLFENPALIRAIDAATAANKTVHLMGLVSDGGVHSSIEHLYALVEMARDRGASDVAIHCFLDGRDTPPSSGADFVAALERRLGELGSGRVATVMGRYWAMDRDQRWERVRRAWAAMVLGEAAQAAPASPGGSPGARPVESGAVASIRASYEAGITDEFVEPTIVSGEPMRDGDAVIFFNFRPDRAREITRALVDPEFTGFSRERTLKLHFVCLTDYDPTIPAAVAFPKALLADTLADVLSREGMRQLHISETEKYAHVTFFFNGGTEEPKAGETRVLIPSPKAATYDLQPEMSAPEIGDRLVEAIESRAADFYVVNFANGDMVGHTGVIEAAVSAVEAVDLQVGRVVSAVVAAGGAVLITADHGNAEQMLDGEGVCTAHSLHPVPLVAVNTGAVGLNCGRLADVAPTVLQVMGIPAPESWTGVSLAVY